VSSATKPTSTGAWLGSDGSDLPALPLVAAELSAILDDPKTTGQQVAEIVVRGPVMAARMLRLVNSAYFGLADEVTNIRQAVYLLGLRRVRTVALTAAVISAFQDVRAGRFDLSRFWRHSLGMAAVCAALARHCGTFDIEAAFSLGLLHDLGKVVLVRYRPDDAERVIENAERNRISFHQSEQDILPVTHPQLGAWLAGRWGLPPVLVDGMAHHHDPLDEELAPLDAALRFANYLCAVKGVTTSGSCGEPEVSPQVWAALRLKSIELPLLIEVINAEIATTEDLLRSA